MNKIIYAILAVLTTLSVSSCKNDFDFEEARNINTETVNTFNENFTKLYGEVHPNETWDYSTKVETKAADNSDEYFVSKRYLIEDLSAVEANFVDFNDIVIDLIQTRKKTANGYEVTGEKAIIRALGGTVNFDLMIGSHIVFTKKTSKYDVSTIYNTGWNPVSQRANKEINYNEVLAEIDLSNYGTLPIWNFDNNNIHVVMKPETKDKLNSDKIFSSLGDKALDEYVLNFPKKGAIPAMIAFDIDKEWLPERVGIKAPTDIWWQRKY